MATALRSALVICILSVFVISSSGVIPYAHADTASVDNVECDYSSVAVGVSDLCVVQIGYDHNIDIGTVNLQASDGVYATPENQACNVTGGECILDFYYTDTNVGEMVLTATLTPNAGVSPTCIDCTYDVFVGYAATTVVACTPTEVTDVSSTTCTATVSGSDSEPTPTGTVSFTADGFSPSDFSPNPCSLGTVTATAGSCSVVFFDSDAQGSGYPDVFVDAGYSGDGNYVSGNGYTNVPVLTCSVTLGVQSCTINLQPSPGTTALYSPGTQVGVVLSGYSETSGSVTMSSVSYAGSPPSGVPGVVGVTGPSYFDVQVTGISDGTAMVCFPGSPGPGTTVEYWTGSAYQTLGVLSSPPALSGYTCVSIDTDLLNGTPFVVGTLSSTTVTETTTATATSTVTTTSVTTVTSATTTTSTATSTKYTVTGTCPDPAGVDQLQPATSTTTVTVTTTTTTTSTTTSTVTTRVTSTATVTSVVTSPTCTESVSTPSGVPQFPVAGLGAVLIAALLLPLLALARRKMSGSRWLPERSAA